MSSDKKLGGVQMNLDRIILRNGPFSHEYFQPGNETKNFLHEICKVLIIGAGGMGCEVLKNLSVTGFRNIDIIDMDVVEEKDFSKSIFFRNYDIGKGKAEVAVEKMKRRFRGEKINLKGHLAKLQDFDEDFFRPFHIIISCLDNISARRWINSVINNLVEFEDDEEGEGEAVDMSTVKIFIDGGTEEFRGQVQVITPKISHCYECILDLFPPPERYHHGHYISPRIPEHCIGYGLEMRWSSLRPKIIKKNGADYVIPNDQRFDGSNPDHFEFVYQEARKRAVEFGIHGVTRELCEKIVQNIIPKSVSCDSVIASVISNECLKAATLMYETMKTYMMYNGNDSVYTYTYEPMRKENCMTCSGPPRFKLEVSEEKTTLGELVDLVLEKCKALPSSEGRDFRSGREGLSIFRSEASYIWNLKFDTFKKLSLENEKKTIKQLGYSESDEFVVRVCEEKQVSWSHVSREEEIFFRLRFVD